MRKIKYKIISSIFFFIINLISEIICDLNIHIIPHTHLTPGWRKTIEKCYDHETIVDIFNTITNALYLDPTYKKTFVINDIYYFKQWYEGTNPDNELRIRKLLKDKRLEFVSGSLIINDEATTSYHDIIDQIRMGHQYLLEKFNFSPKTAWYVDTYGHSAGNAYILSKFNFDYLVMGRIHPDYLELLVKNNSTEFYWQPFETFSNDTIFTHALLLPYGFKSFQKDLRRNTTFFCKEANSYLNQLLKTIATSYRGLRHNNIMFLLGDNFQYKDSNLFSNIDCLIKAFNDEKNQKDFQKIFGTTEKINFFYSTTQKYFDAVEKDLIKNNQKLEIIKNTDFFPLKTNCFWTGFYTSRPFLKGYIRKVSNSYYSLSKYLSSIRLINESIFINEENNTMTNIHLLREIVSLLQHHNAITGTSKQYVSEDYINIMENRIRELEINVKENIEIKLKIKIGSICYNNYLVDQKLCSGEYMIADDDIKRNNTIKIGLYNPYIFSSPSSPNKLLINIEIFDSHGYYEIEGLKSDFFCINEYNLKNEDYYKFKNKCFLNFFYEFKKDEQISIIILKEVEKKEKSNKYYSLNKIKNITKLQLIKDKYNIKSLLFYPKDFEFNIEYYNENQKLTNLNFTYYDAMYYVNAGNCTDGIYQFSPYNKYPEKIKIEEENSFYFIGELGIVFLTRNLDASFTIFSIFYDPFFAKVEHLFDSVLDSYFLNKFSFGYSFVLKTNINNTKEDNKPIFYTDINGLEMMKRKVNTFNYNETAELSIAGNFYPVTSSISIKDEDKNNENKKILTIFTDRPQAGTGLLPGAIILVIQRMSFGTDNQGIKENMFEEESMNNTHFKTTHFILFGLNIFNEKSNKSNSVKKTDLLNFIYNYFNSGIFMFKIEHEGKDFEKKINKNNYLVYNLFDKHVKVSPDIRSSYQVIKSNLIIAGFFRYNNYFFNLNQGKEINEDDELKLGIISLNFTNDVNFGIYFDKKGINYNFNKKDILYNYIKNKLINPKNKNITLSLKHNEFLFIYFYFDN